MYFWKPETVAGEKLCKPDPDANNPNSHTQSIAQLGANTASARIAACNSLPTGVVWDGITGRNLC